MKITYRIGNIEDIEAITELSVLLYHGDEYDDLFASNKEDLENPEMAIFLAFDEDKALGFSHASLRHDYVEGTSGGIIGYLEGIYVNPDYRGHGIAKSLAALCEDWARKKGCHEFASDCLLDNTDSLKFHLGIGFTEANRIICFTKNL